MRASSGPRAAAAAALWVFAAACGDDASTSDIDGGVSLADAGSAPSDAGARPPRPPEFRLVDENPSSSTYEAEVSPRDYLERVSGWYFTRAS